MLLEKELKSVRIKEMSSADSAERATGRAKRTRHVDLDVLIEDHLGSTNSITDKHCHTAPSSSPGAAADRHSESSPRLLVFDTSYYPWNVMS